MWRDLRALSWVCLFGAAACSVNVQGSRPWLDEPAASDKDFGNIVDAADAETNMSLLDAGIVPRDASTPGVDGSATASPGDRLLGYYAEKRSFRTIQTVNQSGVSDVRVLTTSYALVRITKENGRFAFREKACKVETQNEGGAIPVFVEIKDEVPQKMPEMASELIVNMTGYQLKWKRPLTSVAVGWEPASPLDTLPETPDDPRVRDMDEDGNPGVTAHVKADLGIFSVIDDDMYLVQWNRSQYEGVVAADGKLTGENFDSSEQRVIDSPNNLLKQPTPISADPDTADNKIVLVPLSSPISCSALISQIATLFP